MCVFAPFVRQKDWTGSLVKGQRIVDRLGSVRFDSVAGVCIANERRLVVGHEEKGWVESELK